MLEHNFGTKCRVGCWGAGAGAGLLAIILLSFQANLFAAVLVGIALAVLMAQVLIQLVCHNDELAQSGMSEAAPDDAAKPMAEATESPAAAVAAAGAGAAPAGQPASDKADDTGADSASQTVKSGTLLKGEQEVAQSAGSWSYTNDDRAAKAATKKPEDLDKMDDSAHLFVSEDADAEAGAQVKPDFDAHGASGGDGEGKKPEGLSGPRDGKADNLKEIKGVGPKLETLLNDLGFYHFDQIANWSEAEIAWVDANLKGFKGRASRDEWISQAKILASGGDTEFSKRVDEGDVY